MKLEAARKALLCNLNEIHKEIPPVIENLKEQNEMKTL